MGYCIARDKMAQVIQINLSHSRGAQDLLSQVMEDGGFDIAMISEPYRIPTRDRSVRGRSRLTLVCGDFLGFRLGGPFQFRVPEQKWRSRSGLLGVWRGLPLGPAGLASLRPEGACGR